MKRSLIRSIYLTARSIASTSIVVFTVALPIASAQVARPSATDLVQHEIGMLQLLGGGTTLSPAERQQAARVVQLALQAAPEAWIGFYARDTRILGRAAAHDDPDVALLQEQGRLNAEIGAAAVPALQPASTIEREIIRAHDPTVAFVPVAKLLLTERGLEALQRDAAFVAAKAALPPPSPQFVSNAQVRLRSGLSSDDAQYANALSHVRSNAAVLASGYGQMAPAKQQRALAIVRSYVGDAAGAERDWRLAIASAQLAVAVHVGMTQNAGGLPGAMMGNTLMRGMVDRQMQQNMWSMRHPECGVVGNHPSSCGRDAPIMRPIAPY